MLIKKKCKICNIEFYGKQDQVYHSNECKFKDPEYKSSLGKKNKIFSSFRCNYCNKIFKSNLSGIFTKHLLELHNIILDNLEKYCTNISKEEYNILTKKEGIKTQCKLCDFIATAKDEKSVTTSIATHIKLKHNLTMIDYVKQFPEEENIIGIYYKRQLKIMKNEKNHVICLICHEKFGRLTNKHLEKHNLTPTEYKAKYGNTMSESSNEKQRNASLKINKLQKQNREILGLPLPIHTEKGIETRIKNNFEKFIYKSLEINLEILSTFENYKNNIIKYKCLICNHIGEIKENQRLRCYSCLPKFKSKEQEELRYYLEHDLNLYIEESNRTILNGLEIDLFIPEYNIAIEYNGLYWHSEFGNNRNELYHINKTQLALKNNISLIHIFSDEWNNKKEIVKNRLKHIFNKDIIKIGARKTIIKEIEPIQAKEFLLKYHIQGYVASKVKLGAFFNDKLIAVMTFGDLRKALGNKNKINNVYELLRYSLCNDYNVSGLGSKFIHYFIKNYIVEEIISYADVRWSPNPNKTFYIKCGFEFEKITRPNYWYLNDNYDERLYRYKFRRSELLKEGFDENLTEWEIMKQKGYDKIWDCGSYKFIFKNKNGLLN
jgi:hypothetical protein